MVVYCKGLDNYADDWSDGQIRNLGVAPHGPKLLQLAWTPPFTQRHLSQVVHDYCD